MLEWADTVYTQPGTAKPPAAMAERRLQAQCIVPSRLQPWRLAEEQADAERERKAAAARERECEREEARLQVRIFISQRQPALRASAVLDLSPWAVSCPLPACSALLTR
jgi:hypothetical protein